jgi:hypothetical protein
MVDIEYKPKSAKIPVYGETDVLVVGGGIAGVAAAIAAAREGKKVTVIEKGIVLGGQATLGHVCVYLALDDGMGNKVFGGIAEELFHVTIKYGYNSLPRGWTYGIKQLENPIGRYRSHFNIPAAVMAFDELMKELGVTVIFDVVFSEPLMDGDTCKGVIMETKQGRVAYLAKMIVDSSGDADVLYRAGASCAEQDSIVSHWCYELEFERMKRGIEKGEMLDTMTLRWLGLRPDMDNTDSEIPKFPGTTIDGVNGWVKTSREIALRYLKEKMKPSYAMISLPFMPQFRMTRRITGIKQLNMDTPDTFLEDSVGIVDYCLANPASVYEFPYGGILDPKLKNISAAGRIVAAEGAGWELMRLIPPAAFTGQVAGTASSIAIDQGCALQDIDIKTLQRKLEATGVILHVPDYMKGNKTKSQLLDPKKVADPYIKADSLAYH